MARTKKGIVCKNCGEPIRFVRHNGKCIPCNRKAVLISPAYDSSDVYFRGNGEKITGIYDPYGYYCYRPHICPKPINIEELTLG